MIQQVWQAHLLHLPKQKNHIAHASCSHLHMLLHLFPLPMKQSYKGIPSLSLSPSYPLGLFISLPDFLTCQTYISTKVTKYPRFCLQSSPLGYSYHTIFFSTEKMETGRPLVRMVRTNYKEVGNTHSNIYRRLVNDAPAITISHYRKSMLIHPSQHRGLSFREACRLQSFPDWCRFMGAVSLQQQQLANAVPPLMATAVAKAIGDLWWKVTCSSSFSTNKSLF